MTVSETICKPAPPRPTDVRPLAVFDLDGTLVRGNTFLGFLTTFARRHGLRRPLAELPFFVAAYLCRLMSDFELKQRLMSRFLSGTSAADVDSHTEWFCKHWLPPRIHPLGHQWLIHHLDSGHRAILLSASPDVYVPAVGQSLGIGESICTRVAVDDGRYTGNIIGDNCKGAAKLRALQDHLRRVQPPDESYAYGDSSHDLPILRWVQHGYLVSRNKLVPVKYSANEAATR